MLAARNTDPATSHAAARRAPSARNDDRRAVLAEHAKAHLTGLTDFELAGLLDRQQTSVGKRRGELRDAGFIEATPYRRPSPSGSPAIVWLITSLGKMRYLGTA